MKCTNLMVEDIPKWKHCIEHWLFQFAVLIAFWIFYYCFNRRIIGYRASQKARTGQFLCVYLYPTLPSLWGQYKNPIALIAKWKRIIIVSKFHNHFIVWVTSKREFELGSIFISLFSLAVPYLLVSSVNFGFRLLFSLSLFSKTISWVGGRLLYN